ncbi:MAG: YIP1 family protein [Chloroflexi bacterium]|nr:YIP1 family protein [Chloroflexota bacterium]
MKAFVSYIGGTITRPRNTFVRLLADSRRYRYGLISMLAIVTLYTLAILLLELADADITIPAWLAIPAENYYFWEVFFIAPVMILAWILAAGVVQVLGRCFGGDGEYEDVFTLLGFGIAVPTYTTLIADWATALLFLSGAISQTKWLQLTSHGFWQVFVLGYLGAQLIWLIALFCIAAATVHKLRWRRAAFPGIVGVLVYQITLLVFIR